MHCNTTTVVPELFLEIKKKINKKNKRHTNIKYTKELTQPVLSAWIPEAIGVGFPRLGEVELLSLLGAVEEDGPAAAVRLHVAPHSHALVGAAGLGWVREGGRLCAGLCISLRVRIGLERFKNCD